MRYQRSALLASACAYALAMAAVANAQTTESKKQEKISTLEEIVVTAQKRTENLQEVPIAVTAITAESREIIGLTTVEDLTNFVPGLTFNGALDRASIRGIGRTTNAVGSDPGVALYVDGFYSSSMAQAGRTTLFNDRIEVLRGPQGTLYGRNSMGGAINTTSRRPKDSLGAEVRTSIGDYGLVNVEGTLTGPIADWLRFRVSAGTYNQHDGYFTNISGGPDEGGVRNDQTYEVSFTGNLGSSVDFLLKWERGQWDRLGRSTASFTPYATNKCPAASATQVTACSATNLLLTTTGAYGFWSSSGPSALYNEAVNRSGPLPQGQTVLYRATPAYTVANPANPDNRRQFNTNTPAQQLLDDNNTFVTHLTWHAPGFDVKWIGGWQEYLYTAYTDFDNSDRDHYVYTPGGASPTLADFQNQVSIYNTAISKYVEDKTYWSNEINLTSTGDGPLKWLAGLYQYSEGYMQHAGQVFNPDQVELRTVYQRPASTSAMPPNVLAAPNPVGAFNDPTSHVDVASRAAFGQLDWQFADAWEATLGARYSEDEKEGWETRRNVVWDPTVFGATARAYDNTPPNACNVAVNDNTPAGVSITRLPDGTLAPAVASLAAPAGSPASCGQRTVETREWADWSGRSGIRWNMSDTTNAFVTYNRGYKAGAIRIGGFETDVDSEPETLNAYEVGLKTELFDRKLRLNTAAYYYDYMDYQIPLTRVDEANPGRTITDYYNIPKVESYGVELESTWLVTDSLTLNINYGYMGTEIQSDLLMSDALDVQGTVAKAAGDTCYYLTPGQPPSTTPPTASATCYQNVNGSPLNNSPEHKVSFNATYSWRLESGTLSLSGSYNWRDAASSQLIDREYYKTDAYGTASARAVWSDSEGRYSVIAHVENLLDDDTYNSVSASSLNGEIVKQYSLNPPRTMGVDFQFRFGSENR